VEREDPGPAGTFVEPVTRNGLDVELQRQASVFTREGIVSNVLRRSSPATVEAKRALS